MSMERDLRTTIRKVVLEELKDFQIAPTIPAYTTALQLMLPHVTAQETEIYIAIVAEIGWAESKDENYGLVSTPAEGGGGA